MDLADDAIIRRIQDGHTRDYEILVRRYQQALVRFLTHFIGDSDDAQSIAQDAFVRVYMALPRYHPSGRFKSLLFTSARNLAINFSKKSNRNVSLSGLMEAGKEKKTLSTSATPEAHFEREDQTLRLNEALRSLSHNQRLALVLKVYLQYSYKQIREITGWSIPKIETLISRGRTSLQRRIKMQDRQRETVVETEE